MRLRFRPKLITNGNQTLLTLEQFLALPERAEDGSLYELSEGELKKVPPPEYRHGLIMFKIGTVLMNALLPEEYIIAVGMPVSYRCGGCRFLARPESEHRYCPRS